MRSALFIAAAALFLSHPAVVAADFMPVELDPIQHETAQLVIVAHDGTEKAYTPADLENFATYRVVTTTPWREEAAQFEGVMLSDILAAHGLDQVDLITVTAENDYRTSMPRELLETVEILVATRVDGRPHSRRARGPIQFVIDAETYSSSNLTSESNFVWMAARIEAGS